MAKRQYTDDDKARVLASLAGNGGVVSRAAAETGIPEQTVRDWKKQSQSGTMPERVEARACELASEFVEAATQVRDEALVRLRAQLHEAKPRDLVTIIGVLDDKIARASGLATQRVEVTHTGPTPEELREQLKGFLAESVKAAHDRDAVIIDAEVVEQVPRALPSPLSTQEFLHD